MRNNDILNQHLSFSNLDYNDFILYKTKPQFCKITFFQYINGLIIMAIHKSCNDIKRQVRGYKYSIVEHVAKV